MFVAGIAGKAGSGKDTCAAFLVDRGFKRYAFADPIKSTINPLFGWGSRHAFGDLKEEVDPYWGVSPRYVYQVFGTEFARELIRDDFWLKVAELHLRDVPLVVIPDVRFENEATWVRKHGVLFHLYSNRSANALAHKSEAGVERKPEDFRILNYGSREDLSREMLRVYSDILSPRIH
jgi:hypothetical protein